MKPSLLLPRYFKLIGLLMVVPGLIMGLLFQYKNNNFPYYDYSPLKRIFTFPSAGIDTFNDEIIITLLVTGFAFIGFSRLKNENETTTQLRLRALHWSVLACFGLLSVFLIIYYTGILLKLPIIINHDPVFDITTYNLFVPLIVFELRFYYLLAIKKNEILARSQLLPYKPFKLMGKVAMCSFIILVPFAFAIKWVENFMFSGVLCLLPAAILFWMASKEKNDSETIEGTRLKALQIACYINYVLVVILTWLVYSLGFLAVLYIGLISVPLIFLSVFYWMLAKEKKVATSANLTAGAAT